VWLKRLRFEGTRRKGWIRTAAEGWRRWEITDFPDVGRPLGGRDLGRGRRMRLGCCRDHYSQAYLPHVFPATVLAEGYGGAAQTVELVLGEEQQVLPAALRNGQQKTRC